MAKRKAGLHRKISSIFDGVPVPGSDKSGQQGLPVQEQKSQQSISAPPELQRDVKPPEKDKLRPKPVEQAKPKPKSKRRKRKRYKFSAPIPGINEQNEKKKIMIMMILLVLLTFILVRTFLPMLSKKEETKSEAEEIMAKALRHKIDTTIAWKVPELYPATVRDPMRTGRFRDPGTGEWIDKIIGPEKTGDIKKPQNDAETAGFYGKIVIQSILYSRQGRSIVIGNKILYEGNAVEGATIIKINRDSVIFSIGGQQFTVPLQK